MQKTQSKTRTFSWLASVTGAEVAKTETSFFKVQNTFLYNGPFLTVIVLDLTQIVYYFAQTILVLIIVFFLISLTRLGCVDFNSRNRIFLPLSILLVPLAAIFLLFPPSLSGRLQVTGAESWQFWGPDFRFFHSRFFYQLGLGLGCQNMHQLIASVAWLVKVLAGKGMYLGLGLNSNCRFNLDVATIQVLAFFLNP